MNIQISSEYPWGIVSNYKNPVLVEIYDWKPNSNLKPFVSMKNIDGSIQAGSHLIIVDDSSCRGTTKTKSDPKILNYYRQFLVKGFGDRFFEFRIFGRFKTGESPSFSKPMKHLISKKN